MSQTIDIAERKVGAFWEALAEAEKGDRVVYHVGDHCGGVHRRDAADAERQGVCLLFCKRMSNGQFAYLAVKR